MVSIKDFRKRVGKILVFSDKVVLFCSGRIIKYVFSNWFINLGYQKVIVIEFQLFYMYEVYFVCLLKLVL